MKAEELRCGNWVMTPIYKEFRATPKTLYRLFKDEDSVQPIPLTEVWLVKFGFNILLTEKESILYRKNSQDVNVHPIGGFTYGVRGVPVVKIKNVHQLQNLYFALTGEELTIPI
jgi:hypothetical protein